MDGLQFGTIATPSKITLLAACFLASIGCNREGESGTSTREYASAGDAGSHAENTATPRVVLTEPSIDELERFIPQEQKEILRCELSEDIAVTPEPTVGMAPLRAKFDSIRSRAPCGTIVSRKWNFGDGTTASGVSVMHVYTKPGRYVATVTLKDDHGNYNRAALEYAITVRATDPLYTIRGQITDARANGINNVIVTLSGSRSATTATDLDGYYSFTNLASGGDYTVTPSLVEYTFKPQKRGFRHLSDDESGTNFIGALK